MCSNLNITTDPHGMILIDGERDNAIAKKLTTLLAYLSEIFRKHAVENPHAVALEITLNGKMNGHYIIVDVPHQIREKNPEAKKWKIPSDIIQMNEFYFNKINELH